MDCKTATLVYKGGNYLENIREIFPEAWQFLEEVSFAYVAGKADNFDSAIRDIVGEKPFKYRMVHRDDKDQLTKDLGDLLGDITSRLMLEKHFSAVVGKSLFFSTICCNSHLTADHELTLDEVLPLQCAAVTLQ
jgi:hypothetical protein